MRRWAVIVEIVWLRQIVKRVWMQWKYGVWILE